MRGRRARGVGPTAALVAAVTAGAAGALAGQESVELPSADRRVNLSLEEVYAIGGAMEEAEWQIFGDLPGRSSLAFDRDGNLHVFDRDNFRVVVVDPSGALVREFGKAGEGPEEWRMPIAMTVMRDGSVVITDMGHRAYLVHGPDGELQRRLSIETEGGGFSIGRFQPDPRGGHVYSSQGGGFRISVNSGPGGGDEPAGRAIDRVSLADGSETAFFTAWQPPREGGPTQVSGGSTTFRVSSAGPRAFEPDLHVGVLPDGGVAVVDSTDWTVKVVGPDGSPRHTLRRPGLRPREVTDEIEEQEKARRLAELEAGEGPQMRVMVQGPGGAASPISQDQIREMQRDQIAQTEFFPVIPVVSRMAAGWSGTLWIERRAERWWESGPVDLVRPDGRYIGTLAADGPGIPAAFGPDGLVAYLERDEFDVPTIRVQRLPEPLR